MGIKKNEVQHFKDTPEIQHFPAEKVSKGDNAYGIGWANLVRKYLETAYLAENPQVEIVSDGVTYKVLRREKVTAFYDVDGNTIFDVENKRLEKEYGYLMKGTAASESAESTEAVLDEERDKESPEEKAAEVPADDVKAKAISKLDSEFLSLKKESDKKFAEPCIDYLKKRCEEDFAICEDILQDHKTWRKCYDYVYGQAKKKLNNTSGAVWHETVFEWVEDYFHLDDKDIEEQKAKEVAERKRKQDEAAKKAEKKQKSAKKENRPNTKKAENKTAEKPAPKMNEYYPDLMERIVRREPNAYLASLYWDSEMFGRNTAARKQNESGAAEKDYKAALLEMFSDMDTYFDTKHKRSVAEKYRNFFMRVTPFATNKDYKAIYEGLVSGDPKLRSYRALFQRIYGRYISDAKKKEGIL